jgi:hypothetical protein
MQPQTSKRSVDEYGYPLYLDAENDPALWVDCPDPWNLRGRLPMTPVWKYEKRLIPPNPPTPEAVAKAQFIDKTYQWNGSASAKAARSQSRN